MGTVGSIPSERWVTLDAADGTRWVADAGFLGSRWRCLWGHGCQGIGDTVAPELMQGCCSVGAELTDESDAANVAAHAACIPVGRWQHAALAADSPHGPFSGADRRATALASGACIFFNHPGFAGGVGCALHLAALAAGESPLEWKPNVCWQVPVRIDEHCDGDGRTVLVLRRWRGGDWGEGNAPAWWCTEAHEAYEGDEPVHRSMANELSELCGPSVAATLSRLVEEAHGPLQAADTPSPDAPSPDAPSPGTLVEPGP
jgi:hypothetical protein